MIIGVVLVAVVIDYEFKNNESVMFIFALSEDNLEF